MKMQTLVSNTATRSVSLVPTGHLGKRSFTYPMLLKGLPVVSSSGRQAELRTCSKVQRYRRVAVCSQSGSGALEEEGYKFMFLPNGEVIQMPKQRSTVGPIYDLSREQALHVQMQALQANNDPYPDHGIEVCYRFANFDPFQRSTYFGRSLDLGQFERFRRVMHSPYYHVLLDHSAYQVLSSLELREEAWVARIAVQDGDCMEAPKEFTVTMVQRLGGVYDGFWYTDSFLAEGQDWEKVLRLGI